MDRLMRLFCVKYLSTSRQEITIYLSAHRARGARNQLIRNGVAATDVLSATSVLPVSTRPGEIGLVR